MKLAGAAFILLSAGTVGYRTARAMRERTLLLRQILHALQILRNEIAFCGTPLPQAFALMAASCTGPLETVFAQTAKQMDAHRWMPPSAAVEQTLNRIRDAGTVQVLRELAVGLGKYDLDAQLQAISHAKSTVEELLKHSEQERAVKSGLYETLGICAGLSLVILLL